MAYAVQPSQGIHFSLPNYPNMVVAAVDTGGVGQVVILGTAPAGTLEYDALAVLWGPGDISQTGMDEGTFLNTVIVPAANAALASFQIQNAPAVPGAAPTTIANTNNGLWQYFKLDNGQLVFKPYP